MLVQVGGEAVVVSGWVPAGTRSEEFSERGGPFVEKNKSGFELVQGTESFIVLEGSGRWKFQVRHFTFSLLWHWITLYPLAAGGGRQEDR